MAIKDKIRGVLVGRQDRQYEKRLEELSLTHDRWEKKRERAASLDGSVAVHYFGEAPLETADAEEGEPVPEPETEETPGVFCVLYSDIESYIESGALLTCEDSEIVIFARKEGRLSVGAAGLIRRYFADNPAMRLVYGDEDELLADGTYDKPYFKPDWSPETYACSFYIGSCFAVRGSSLKNTLLHAAPEVLTKEQKELRGQLLGGLADALFMKLATAAGAFRKRQGTSFPVGHIPEILFHLEEGQDLFMGRRYPTAATAPNNTFLLPVAGTPTDVSKDLVSIIIPTKDHPEILKACLDSIRETCDAACPFEILVVDNGSTGYNKLVIANHLAAMERRDGLVRVQYIHEPMEFNFSRMCNLGASRAKGNLLLFLNDDITAKTKGWLMTMALFARRAHVGAVGAKLLYPPADQRIGGPEEIADPRDTGEVPNKIQHAGVTNVRLGPMHKLQYLSDSHVCYFGFNRGVRNLLAVTGACLMIEKQKFDEAGGLPEDMAVAFNDVDLCYTLYEQGYYQVQCNNVILWHHESLSRGLDTLDREKMERLAGEHRILMGRHPDLYNVDPFYSVHLVEDEHISEIRPLYEVTQPSEIPLGSLSHHAEGLPEIPVDAVVRIGVEYADPLVYWNTGRRGDLSEGYFVKGYAFVIGADNACYDRRLLFRKLSEQPTVDGKSVALVAQTEIWSMPVNDWYRPDIAAKLEDQTHVELAGYRVRIGREDLPPGIYQLGMLVLDRTSRQRLINWVENRITIGQEDGRG